jgi:hypothetical protein
MQWWSAVISRQGIHPLRARLASEHCLAALDELEAKTLEQTDARQVPRIGDAQDASDTGRREEQLHRLAHRTTGDATTLRRRLESEADSAASAVFGQIQADVSDERVGLRCTDSELHPLAKCEEWRTVHFVEELKRLGVGHRRPTLIAAKLRYRAIELERLAVAWVQAAQATTRELAWQQRLVHDG